MRPIAKSWSPVVLDANGYADDVATGAGTTLTLTASTPGDGLAHEVTILNNSGTDHSAGSKTVTVVGTDADGRSQTRTIAGPAAGPGTTVTTTGYYFASVSSVTFSATCGADTFDVGWNGVAAGPTIPLEWRSNAAAGIHVDISGTINWTVEQTFANIYDSQPSTLPWAPITSPVDLDDITTDATGTATLGANAVRFFLNSVSAGATAAMYVSQPGGYSL